MSCLYYSFAPITYHAYYMNIFFKAIVNILLVITSVVAIQAQWEQVQLPSPFANSYYLDVFSYHLILIMAGLLVLMEKFLELLMLGNRGMVR